MCTNSQVSVSSLLQIGITRLLLPTDTAVSPSVAYKFWTSERGKVPFCYLGQGGNQSSCLEV